MTLKNILKRSFMIISLLAVCFLFSGSAQTSTWTVQTLKEYVDMKFDLQNIAITKQENAYNDRFNNTNEWRASYDDLIKVMQRDYLPKSEFLSLKEQVDKIENKQNAIDNQKAGGSNTFYIIIAIISALVAFFALARNFISGIYQKSKEGK